MAVTAHTANWFAQPVASDAEGIDGQSDGPNPR